MTEWRSDRRIRVCCADDHPVVRDGLSNLIGLQPDMALVGSASNGLDAVALYDGLRPDVMLLDLEMPVMSGLVALSSIRHKHPSAVVIVLTMHDGDHTIRSALKEGACAYLLKDSMTDTVVQAIRDAHAGSVQVSPIITDRLTDRTKVGLSARETEVLSHIAQGLRNKEVAAILGISEETVHVHVKHIFTKLRVNDRTGALAVAWKRGFIRLP